MRGDEFLRGILSDRQSLRRYLAEIDVPPCLPRAPFYCPLPDPEKGERDVCTHGGRVSGHRHSVATWLRLLRRAYPGRYHHRTNPDAMLGPRRAPPAEGFPWIVLGGWSEARVGRATRLAWAIERAVGEVAALEAAGVDLSGRQAAVKEVGGALRAWRVEVYAAREAADCRLFREGDWWRGRAAEKSRRFLGLFGADVCAAREARKAKRKAVRFEEWFDAGKGKPAPEGEKP